MRRPFTTTLAFMSGKQSKRARQARRTRPVREVRASQMKEAAARVLALGFGDVQASRPRQVAIGWLRAAMAEADAIVRLTQSGYGYAAAPNRRSFFEIALRLQWLEGLDDRDGAIDSMLEEEQRQARAHTGHLAEMGMSSLPDFSDLEAVVIEATRDKSVAAQAKQFTAAAKAIESSALGLFRAWREETQYTHATVKLGLSYAPAQDGRFIDGTPQIMDPDFDTLLTVAIFAVAMSGRVLLDEGAGREVYDRIFNAFFEGIRAGL